MQKPEKLFLLCYKSCNVQRKIIHALLAKVEHNLAFDVSDHLVSLIQNLHVDKESLSRTSFGRTKASKLICNVIGAYGKECTVDILENTTFFIIIDASTNIGTTKNLAIIARFYKDKNISDTFLGLIDIVDGTASNVYNVIVNFFVKNNIRLQKKHGRFCC